MDLSGLPRTVPAWAAAIFLLLASCGNGDARPFQQLLVRELLFEIESDVPGARHEYESRGTVAEAELWKLLESLEGEDLGTALSLLEDAAPRLVTEGKSTIQRALRSEVRSVRAAAVRVCVLAGQLDPELAMLLYPVLTDANWNMGIPAARALAAQSAEERDRLLRLVADREAPTESRHSANSGLTVWVLADGDEVARTHVMDTLLRVAAEEPHSTLRTMLEYNADLLSAPK